MTRSGLNNNPPVNLQFYTGSVSIKPFGFSKDSRTKALAPELRDDRAAFIGRTKIEVPISATDRTLVPFDLWPAQREVLATIERERLIDILKARQIGLSWLVCGFVLADCTTHEGQPWLLLSQGQLEANELAHRISLMYHEHQDKAALPALIKDNTGELVWSNRSRVISLAATRRAGRSFTAAGVVLDEWAFMSWPKETLAAVKPTIDAGGRLIILSSADGMGTTYHQHYNAAKAGANGYTAIFLPWSARPDRAPDWRTQKLIESGGDIQTIKREYPENDIEAFSAAAGQVYDVWSDGPPDGNVTEAAEYVPGGGSVYWANDDGYAGAIDPATGQYTATSHPRVFLLVQEKSDGHLDVFAEDYRIQTELDPHLAEVLCLPRSLTGVEVAYGLPRLAGSDLIDRLRVVRNEAPERFYPEPEYIAADNAAATAIGIMGNRGFYTRKKPTSIEESVKNTRRMLAPDGNGWRRIRVHPRCKRLRFEMAAYRTNDKGEPLEGHDHGPSALRYLAWTKRLEV